MAIDPTALRLTVRDGQPHARNLASRLMVGLGEQLLTVQTVQGDDRTCSDSVCHGMKEEGEKENRQLEIAGPIPGRVEGTGKGGGHEGKWRQEARVSAFKSHLLALATTRKAGVDGDITVSPHPDLLSLCTNVTHHQPLQETRHRPLGI